MRTWRASSLGSCTRAQICAALGMAPVGTPDKLAAMYQRGVDHEQECLAAMAEKGWLVVQESTKYKSDDGQILIELPIAGAMVTGHLDGIVHTMNGYVGTNGRVLEIKSPFSWAKWETAHKTGDYTDPLMYRYSWQLSAYMHATGLEAVVACVEEGQVKTFGVEVAPRSLEEITGLVRSMEACVESAIVPDECSQVDGWACPYRYLCDDRPDTREDAILDMWMTQYADSKRLRDAADEEMKSVSKHIDAHLGIEDTIRTETGTATRVTRQGSVSIDWKAAESDGIDLGAYKRVGKPSTFVKVTPREVDGTPSDA